MDEVTIWTLGLSDLELGAIGEGIALWLMATLLAHLLLRWIQLLSSHVRALVPIDRQEIGAVNLEAKE